MWGIDRLSAGELGNTRRRLRSSAVALLSQAAAVDARGKPVLDALDELGVRLVRVFGPEHGFDGVAQAEVAVDSDRPAARGRKKKAKTTRRRTRASAPPPPPDEDEANGSGDEAAAADPDAAGEGSEESPERPSLPPELISLYGADRESLSPRPEHFEGIDLLVIDVLSVGARYYTYVWSALLAARAAAAAGVHVMVLDRPNPLSGDPASVEGAPQAEGFTSFVGLESVPIRHAMTVGEMLVHFFARDGHPLGPDGALSLVSPRGWERHRSIPDCRRAC
jgi:uncharacterized protein YbbC (DUF1343 family)